MSSAPLSAAFLASPEFAANPYPHYSRWRAQKSVQKVEGTNAWLVMDYDNAAFVLKEASSFSSSPNLDVSPSLNGADGADHTAIRRLVQPFFSADLQLARRERIATITRNRLELLRHRDSFDAISDLTAPIAHAIACDWLGLTEAGGAIIRAKPVRDVIWTDLEGVLEPGGLCARLLDESTIDTRRLAELTAFFLMAGVETTREFVLLALLTLREQPESIQAAISDPSIVPAMTDELLRLEPPAHTLFRDAEKDVVLGGEFIPGGSMIWVSLAAANRDPERFAEPHKIVPGRKGPRHLSFSVGNHFCLGSHLGRIEGETLLAEIMPYASTILGNFSGPVVHFVGQYGAPSLRQIGRWELSFQ